VIRFPLIVANLIGELLDVAAAMADGSYYEQGKPWDVRELDERVDPAEWGG